MQPEILIQQQDKNYAPMPYGMMAVKEFKPVHRELWAIIRDKQKYNKHGILENAVQGFATLMNVGYSTICRAIKVLKKHGWLLTHQTKGRKILFRALNLSNRKPGYDMQAEFDGYVKMNGLDREGSSK